MNTETEHFLNKIFEIESSYPSLKERLKEYLDLLMKQAKAELGAVFLWEESSQRMRLSYYKGVDYPSVKAINKAYAQNGFKSLAQRTAEKKKPIIIEDLSDTGKKLLRKKIELTKIKSLISLPLVINGHQKIFR